MEIGSWIILCSIISRLSLGRCTVMYTPEKDGTMVQLSHSALETVPHDTQASHASFSFVGHFSLFIPEDFTISPASGRLQCGRPSF